MLKLITVLLIMCLGVSETYKILIVFPAASQSHFILGNGYVRHLLNAGHEVTYITTQHYKNDHPKLRQIVLDSVTNTSTDDNFTLNNILSDKTASKIDIGVVIWFTFELNKGALKNEKVQKLLHDVNEQFDVVITEWLFNDLNAGFAAVFGCPHILSSSLEPHWAISRVIDESFNPAYTIDIISSNIPPLNFLQRVSELWNQLKTVVLMNILDSYENSAYNSIFGPAAIKRGKTLQPLAVTRYNVSMILGNSNQPLSPPIRLPVNYKEVGGYHIESHVSPLPEDIKKIMDGAKHGVIYFSLGSIIKSQHLPEKMKKEILKIFSELKETVLWKFEEDINDLPKNVHVLKWAPQPAILGYPNCKLFISHGGLLSVTEAIYYGVPIVGIPLMADQFLNIDKAVAKGFAVKVSLAYDMAAPLQAAIIKMITDNRYGQKALELSKIYHDRPLSPPEELVYWVEHVVRTGGAAHLRSPALLVPLYQKLYLDLVAIIGGVIFVIVRLLKLIISKVTKPIVSKSKKNK